MIVGVLLPDEGESGGYGAPFPNKTVWRLNVTLGPPRDEEGGWGGDVNSCSLEIYAYNSEGYYQIYFVAAAAAAALFLFFVSLWKAYLISQRLDHRREARFVVN